MNAFLVAQQLFATQHEGHTLRCEHRCLSQQVKTNELCLLLSAERGAFSVEHRSTQPVNQAHVVVTADVANHLCRLYSPRFFRVVHLRHIDLRMLNGSHDAELHALFHIGHSTKECRLLIVIKRTTQGIANLIAECSNARHLSYIGLYTELLARQSARACAPALTIYKDGGVNIVHGSPYLVHRLNVVNSHQVKAEAVNVVFVNPILHALYHELPHHRLLAGCLVATARTVAVAAVCVLAVVVVRIGTLEV